MVIPRSINSRPQYQARERRRLILWEMTKVPCFNLFIKYSKTFFRIILIENTQKVLDFHSENKKLRHKIRVTSFCLTSQIPWRSIWSQLGITSPRSKYMTSGYQPGRFDNQLAGNTISHVQTLGYRVKYSSQYVIIENTTTIFRQGEAILD